MSLSPSLFAPKVTQWVRKPEADWTTDAYGTKTPTYNSRLVRVLAEFPGNSMETDNATGNEVTADRVVLVTPSTTVSEFDEWTLSDGIRYKAAGAPAPYRSPFTGTAVTQVNLRRIS